MEVNENLLTVSAGYIILDTPLKIGDDVILTISGTVITTTDKDNNDGTINRVFKVKGIIANVIKDGKLITESNSE